MKALTYLWMHIRKQVHVVLQKENNSSFTGIQKHPAVCYAHLQPQHFSVMF